MAYDGENRMVRSVDPEGSGSTYTYGGDGLRGTRSVYSGLTTYVWDGSDYLEGRIVMNEKSLSELASDDPGRRFRALMDLRHEYDPKVGVALVKQIRRENASGVWWLLAQCTLPIWLPLFDTTFAGLEDWPFSGCRTLRILELSRGHVLHSAARHVDGWLASAEWESRFAAFRWLSAGGSTMERACEAGELLLKQIHEALEVKPESPSEGAWMDGFYDRKSRETELEQFIASNCPL